VKECDMKEYELSMAKPFTPERRLEGNALIAVFRARRGHEQYPLEVIDCGEYMLWRYRLP